MKWFVAILLLAAVLAASGCVNAPDKFDVNINLNGDRKTDNGDEDKVRSSAPSQLPGCGGGGAEI